MVLDSIIMSGLTDDRLIQDGIRPDTTSIIIYINNLFLSYSQGGGDAAPVRGGGEHALSALSCSFVVKTLSRNSIPHNDLWIHDFS